MSTTSPFTAMLAGGDPRSLGRTAEVVDVVLADPGRLGELFACLDSPDPVVRMRAADGLEKACRARPERFTRFVPRLLGEVAAIAQPSVRWHLAQMLGEVALRPSEAEAARGVLRDQLAGSSDWIVLTSAMSSLAALAGDDPALRADAVRWIGRFADDPRPAVAKRAARVLTALGAS
ncbi:MAG: hypothetical protein IT200_15855 [Thermoleophilia bacterium]|nr:hypothetical protein [Thermoleophilia bacterium]